jgi:Family of unknown function (DUF5947)
MKFIPNEAGLLSPHTASRPAASGLRRFAVAAPSAARATAAEERAPAQDERCELCGERLRSAHAHMVDLGKRSIACACTACALLFTRSGGRYRTVPDRVCHDPRTPLTDAQWAQLRIPVAIAFFFVNSALGRVIAAYPSPAGVTECELDLAAWDRLVAAHPLLGALAPDVEAILVTGGGAREAGGIETFLVPIDVCYSLAGALRLEWHGFDGGAEVKRILADLLASLRERARRFESVDTMNGMTGPEVA